MEFATGIGFEGNELVSYAVDKEGKRFVLPLKDLATRGLPKVKNAEKNIFLYAKFSDWKLGETKEYLEAFGFSSTNEASVRQQCFVTTLDETRNVATSDKGQVFIPALALMRAFFRPVKHLLPTIFKPQVVDRTCRIIYERNVPRLVIDAPWYTNTIQATHTDCTQAISWMAAHQSAFAMANSVHDFTMMGQLSLLLPSATALLRLQGLYVGTNLYVTSVAIQYLIPLDFPKFPLSGLLTKIHFKPAVSHNDQRKVRRHAPLVVEEHANGKIELTDEEWEEIAPLVDSKKNNIPKKFKISQRDLINIILRKIATGQSWNDVDSNIGNCRIACKNFWAWSRKGTMSEIGDILSTMRSAPK